MKIISKIVSLCFFTTWFISCAISEEITFQSNGEITYSYFIDASKYMKMASNPFTKTSLNSNDSSYVPVIRDTILPITCLFDTISKLSIETQKKLEVLKPIVAKVHYNEDEGEFFIHFSANFKNSDSLNSTLATLNSIPKKRNEISSSINLLMITKYNWDGNKFCKSIQTDNLMDSLKEDYDKLSINSLFSRDSLKIKYHFPKEIKKVNNSSAVISQDRKSLSIDYDSYEYLNNSQATDLKVELVK